MCSFSKLILCQPLDQILLEKENDQNNRNTDLVEVKSLIEIMQRITADKVVTKTERHELRLAIQQILPEEF